MEVASRIESGVPRPFPLLLYNSEKINKQSEVLIMEKENKRFSSFKFKIGDIVKDEKRNFEILDTFRAKKSGHMYKWYKYKCNKCGYVGEMVEPSMYKNKNGCPSCAGRIVTPMNCIWNTQRWMCDLGVSEEDAKTHTKGSHDKVKVTCPNCGIKREVRISHIYANKTIFCTCADGVSYPEKFVSSILKQLNLEFVTQLTNKNFKWVANSRYDFYLSDYNIIIETHGIQHYEEIGRKGARTLSEEQENDRFKEQLAKENGIENYIVLDCRYSNINYIKNNILNSELSILFDLSKIDWNKCEEFALSSLIKEICEYYNEHEYMTTKEIGDIFCLTKETIKKYLIKGERLDWCSYSTDKGTKQARKKTMETNRKALSKEVSVLKDGKEVARFSSLRELNDSSLEVLGIKLASSQVCQRLNSKYDKYGQQYKGFTFKYTNNNNKNNEEVA